MFRRVLLLIVTYIIFSVNLAANALPELHFNGFISDNANVLSEQSETLLKRVTI